MVASPAAGAAVFGNCNVQMSLLTNPRGRFDLIWTEIGQFYRFVASRREFPSQAARRRRLLEIIRHDATETGFAKNL